MLRQKELCKRNETSRLLVVEHLSAPCLCCPPGRRKESNQPQGAFFAFIIFIMGAKNAKPTKREKDLEAEMKRLQAQVEEAAFAQRRLSHVTKNVVGEMLTDHVTRSEESKAEIRRKQMEMRRLDEEQRERVLHAREKMQAALKDINNHIEANKHKSFCSCGSDQCGHSCCGRPLGKQTRGYLCCSSRQYDRIDEALGEAPINPYEDVQRYGEVMSDLESPGGAPESRPEEVAHGGKY